MLQFLPPPLFEKNRVRLLVCPSDAVRFQVSHDHVDELLVLKFIQYLRNLLVGGHENS